MGIKVCPGSTIEWMVELHHALALHRWLPQASVPSFCAAEKAVEQLRGDTHRAAIAQPLELDVADPVSISAAVARLHEQRDQKIGVLVNNAGAYAHAAAFLPRPPAAGRYPTQLAPASAFEALARNCELCAQEPPRKGVSSTAWHACTSSPLGAPGAGWTAPCCASCLQRVVSPAAVNFSKQLRQCICACVSIGAHVNTYIAVSFLSFLAKLFLCQKHPA